MPICNFEGCTVELDEYQSCACNDCLPKFLEK